MISPNSNQMFHISGRKFCRHQKNGFIAYIVLVAIALTGFLASEIATRHSQAIQIHHLVVLQNAKKMLTKYVAQNNLCARIKNCNDLGKCAVVDAEKFYYYLVPGDADGACPTTLAEPPMDARTLGQWQIRLRCHQTLSDHNFDVEFKNRGSPYAVLFGSKSGCT